MIVLQIYALIYMSGLAFNQFVTKMDVSKGIMVFENKRDFKRSFIPFYYFYKWYKNLPD